MTDGGLEQGGVVHVASKSRDFLSFARDNDLLDLRHWATSGIWTRINGHIKERVKRKKTGSESCCLTRDVSLNHMTFFLFSLLGFGRGHGYRLKAQSALLVKTTPLSSIPSKMNRF